MILSLAMDRSWQMFRLALICFGSLSADGSLSVLGPVGLRGSLVSPVAVIWDGSLIVIGSLSFDGSFLRAGPLGCCDSLPTLGSLWMSGSVPSYGALGRNGSLR